MAALSKLSNRLAKGWYASQEAPPPLTTEQVLREEARAIHQADLSDKSGVELYCALNRLNSTALCLSGGGIRSGAFALGVIQALAAHPRTANDEPVADRGDSLLAKFHYLSTVSGGGYIGSWLSAWRSRAGFDEVWNYLVRRPDGPDHESDAIAWLRSYSNYLTPQLGFTSADSWALAAVYVRNLIINWLVILPAVCAAILALKIVVVWLIGMSHVNHAAHPRMVIVGFGILFLVIALSYASGSRPSRLKRPGQDCDQRRGSETGFLKGSLIWSLLSAIALTQYLGIVVARGSVILTYPRPLFVAVAALGGLAIYAVGWLVGYLFGRLRERPLRWDLADLLLFSASGLFYGALVGLGFFFFLREANAEPNDPTVLGAVADSPVVYLIFGVPWILLAQWVADLVFVGLTSYRRQFNADQEWLGRSGAWLLVTAVAWSLGMFVTFAGFLTGIDSAPATEFFRFMRQWLVPIVVLMGLLIAIVGTSNLSRFNFGTRGVASFITDLAIAVAGPLFVGALIFSVSIALDYMLLGRHLFAPEFQTMLDELSDDPSPRFDSWLFMLRWLGLGLVVSVLLAVAASKCININRFSLHALYRNRLVRAFLGASRETRRPDPFTGFDDSDDPHIHSLWPRDYVATPVDWRPFHIINMTLNIVSSKRLAWQERKAAPFTVSPLHCGTSISSDTATAGSGSDTIKESGKAASQAAHRPGGAYRPSEQYGDRHGITLGTAMAISGAAANPNMGYHTSPSVTFLMTIFNVRLGWWLGNPGPEGAATFRHEGPATAIVPLVHETFGLTTDTRSYIHVSDGGHFENLGLYEMVRRRCRFIVICDAGRDPDYAFEDLGNAVRKISIDLGVPIRFHKLEALKRRPQDGSDIVEHCDYHAVADIDYQEADGNGVENGLILYVKAGYHGTESAGVRSYAMANRDFPHQSTANQWFSESQFESYRSLGFEIMEDLLYRASRDPEIRDYAKAPSLATLLATLRTATKDAAASAPTTSAKPSQDPECLAAE